MKVAGIAAIAALGAVMVLAACSKEDQRSTPPKAAGEPAAAPRENIPAPVAPVRTPPAETGRVAQQPMSPSTLEKPEAPVPVEASAKRTEEPLLSPEDAAIPTQEEADLEAAQLITEENADAELEKLIREIEEEGGGG